MKKRRLDIRTVVDDLRIDQDLTISELARRSGISRPNLSNFLAGKRSASCETIETLSDTLGLTLCKSRKK
jgi:transcriptional regulator with XRE-family HTH domain